MRGANWRNWIEEDLVFLLQHGVSGGSRTHWIRFGWILRFCLFDHCTSASFNNREPYIQVLDYVLHCTNSMRGLEEFALILLVLMSNSVRPSGGNKDAFGAVLHHIRTLERRCSSLAISPKYKKPFPLHLYFLRHIISTLVCL